MKCSIIDEYVKKQVLMTKALLIKAVLRIQARVQVICNRDNFVTNSTKKMVVEVMKNSFDG